MNTYELITPQTHPDYRKRIANMSEEIWPLFMLQSPISDLYWEDLFTRFSAYQFALWDNATQQIVAKGNSIPLAWDGDLTDLPDGGWDWAFAQSVADHKAGYTPHTQCGLQIAIMPAFQGKGVSKLMVAAMRTIGEKMGLERLIIPVRPSLKSHYPLTPMDNYIKWKNDDGGQNDDGLPFDPWLRVHVRNGGQLIKTCHTAMKIGGSIAQWEKWTAMRFPESGNYVVEGALSPVHMNLEQNEGVYIEPNVWVHHPIA